MKSVEPPKIVMKNVFPPGKVSAYAVVALLRLSRALQGPILVVRWLNPPRANGCFSPSGARCDCGHRPRRPAVQALRQEPDHRRLLPVGRYSRGYCAMP
jgi:hypothetical protein